MNNIVDLLGHVVDSRANDDREGRPALPGGSLRPPKCAEEMPEQMNRPVDSPIAAQLNTRSVLVVDDDAKVRALIHAVLEEQGYYVLEAIDGKEACSHVTNHKTDLIITDLIMPEQEGLETIQWIRAASPDMKIIAMSGASEASYLRMARHLGANEILRKPLQLRRVGPDRRASAGAFVNG